MSADPKVVADSIRVNCLQLVRLRSITYLDALKGHTAQCHENLQLSLGTTEEGYWRYRLEACDRLLAEEGAAYPPVRAVPS